MGVWVGLGRFIRYNNVILLGAVVATPVRTRRSLRLARFQVLGSKRTRGQIPFFPEDRS